MDKIRNIKTESYPKGMGVSGQGMDRKVEKRVPMGRKIGFGAAFVGVLLFGWWLTDTLLGGRTLTVNSQPLIVATA